MKLGKHSEENIKIKKLESLLKESEKKREKIIKRNAEAYENIKKVCLSNEYGGVYDKKAKLRKIEEIAETELTKMTIELVTLKGAPVIR